MIIGAVDIGGTKTMAALVDNCGNLLLTDRFPTCIQNWEQHFQHCSESLYDLCRQKGVTPHDLAGIGISVPGMTDVRQGRLVHAPFAGWSDVPVKEWFAKALNNGNIQVENDVNACALGEMCFGYGNCYRNYVWITVSTGIGGAIVNEGILVRGEGLAGEIGHIKVEYSNPRTCSCGQAGCLEAQASGSAIFAMLKERLAENPAFAEDFAVCGEVVDVAGCAALAQRGNPVAQEVFDKPAEYLARGIACTVNLLHPQAVILGGGVACSLSLMLPVIRRTLKSLVIPQALPVDIVYTKLKYEAALLGAASLVLYSYHSA